MRPRKLLLVSVALVACAPFSTGAEARPSLPGIFGAFTGVLGGVMGMRSRHAQARSRHYAQPRRHVQRPSPRAPARQVAVVPPSTQGAAAANSEPRSSGAVFWPHLYDDLFDYVFWPSGTDDRLWAYGFGDIVEAMFPAGRRYADANATLSRRQRQTTGSASDEARDASDSAVRLCTSKQGGDAVNALIERINETVQPTDAQQQSLATLRTALERAFEYVKGACRSETSSPSGARLDSMDDRLWVARQALLVTRGPIENFYATLSDEQKARLNGPQPQADQRSVCGQQGGDMAFAQVERRTRPNEQQRPAWEALRMTSFGMSRFLQASCATATATTPVERLDAADKRINAMLYAVVNLRAPLDAFHSSLAARPRARPTTASR